MGGPWGLSGTLGVPPLKGVSSGPLPEMIRGAGPPDIVFHCFYSMEWQVGQSPRALFFDKNVKPREDYSTFRDTHVLHDFSRFSKMSKRRKD